MVDLDLDNYSDLENEVYSNFSIGLGSDSLGFGQSGAAREDAMSNEFCGRKPGIFAKKKRKDEYQDCIRESLKLRGQISSNETDAQKQLALAQLQQAQLQQKMLTEQSQKKGISTTAIIGIALGSVGLITLIVLVARK